MSTKTDNVFYKTFSGTNSLAFMLLPDSKPILLGSLTTISYSMYRDKKPVTLVGKVNVSGYTRGMRVIAGTMILTLINQHLTKDLVEQVDYLGAHGKIKADELPLFDIMVISSNEYGASTRMMIHGVDITDDAQVLSIEDLFTENTFNFVARDIDEFTAYKDTVIKSSSKRSLKIDTVMPYDFDFDNYENARRFMMNNINNEELLKVQSELVRNGLLYKTTGVYDNDTLKAIKRVQSENNIIATGMLDSDTYDIITNDNTDTREIITISKTGGSFVYDDKEKSKINGIVKHKDTFLAKRDGDFYLINFYDSKGYIEVQDTQSSITYDTELYCEPMHPIVAINNEDYKQVGLSINPRNIDLDIKVSAICKYENGKKEAFSKYVIARENEDTSIRLFDFSDAYIYNLAHGSKPIEITFIILSQGNFIYKWKVETRRDLIE